MKRKLYNSGNDVFCRILYKRRDPVLPLRGYAPRKWVYSLPRLRFIRHRRRSALSLSRALVFKSPRFLQQKKPPDWVAFLLAEMRDSVLLLRGVAPRKHSRPVPCRSRCSLFAHSLAFASSATGGACSSAC